MWCGALSDLMCTHTHEGQSRVMWTLWPYRCDIGRWSWGWRLWDLGCWRALWAGGGLAAHIVCIETSWSVSSSLGGGAVALGGMVVVAAGRGQGARRRWAAATAEPHVSGLSEWFWRSGSRWASTSFEEQTRAVPWAVPGIRRGLGSRDIEPYRGISALVAESLLWCGL